MSVLRSALGWGRRTADARMTDVVRIGLVGYADDPDPVTGEPVEVIRELRYEGKGRVAYPSYAVAESTPASQPIAQQDVVVSIPVGVAVVSDGDRVEVVSSSVDPNLVGRKFNVKGQPVAGQVTAYRIAVTEQS